MPIQPRRSAPLDAEPSKTHKSLQNNGAKRSHQSPGINQPPQDTQHGAVLILVLVILTLLAVLGAASARHASQRMLTAVDYQTRLLDSAAGITASSRANIGDGANPAP